MKKFMVVYTVDGETAASFYDKAAEADKAKQDIECGLGEYAEVYERMDTGSGLEYQLIYS